MPKGIKRNFALPAQGKVMEPHIADRLARRFGDLSHPVECSYLRIWTLESSTGARRFRAFIAGHLCLVDARATRWQKAGEVLSLPSVACGTAYSASGFQGKKPLALEECR